MDEYLAKAMDGVKHKAAEFKDIEMHHSKYVKGFLSENSACLVPVDPMISQRQK